METRAHHVMIGLFTLLTAVGALLFALWMSYASGKHDYQPYRIVFQRSVSGLSEGSAVQYNGIEVGDVTELRLNPNDPRQVIANIRVIADTPIKIDTRASLALGSITGSMSVQLSGGAPDSPLLTECSDAEVPEITADPSPIATLLERGEETIDNLNAILENINTLFDDDNRQNAGDILANVATITRMIASQEDALDENMALFGDATREANATLESIRALSDETTRLMREDGRSVMASASQASEDIARAAQRLDALIDQNAGAVERTLRGTQDIAPALASLRSTLSTLDRITRELEESPANFILGRDNIEEFRP